MVHPGRGTPALAFLLLGLAATALAGQDNGACQHLRATASRDIEERLARQSFQVAAIADNRWEGDRTQRAALRFSDGVVVGVKWARSADGGRDLNDEPRYEVAAHRFQQLFLDEADWVVPPTVLRVLPLEVYRQLDPDTQPTFSGTASVLVVVQAWLDEMESYAGPDTARLDDDPHYSRRFAQLNLLTHLINHLDSNYGNVLVSRDCVRMFAVDNGMAFRSPPSPRGTFWRDLHVDALPADAVDRLRTITRDDLARALSVVAEYRVVDDGRMVTVEPGPRLDPHRAIVHRDGVIQLGLTDLELDELWDRIRALIAAVDRGEIGTL